EELARHSRSASARGRKSDAERTSETRAATAVMPGLPARAPLNVRGANGRRPYHMRDPLLDSRVFQQLAQDTGEGNLPALIEVFVKEVRKRAAELEHARKEQNVELLERTCHAMAGSTST